MKKDNKKYYLYQLNVNKLSIVSTLLLILLIIVNELLYKSYFVDFLRIPEQFNIIILLIIAFGYFVLHELLHSLAYVIYGAKFKKITYGLLLEKGVFYCLCKQNITKNNILHSLMYPFIFIGIITYIIGFVCHLPLLVFLSIINISGCSGDIIMFLFISKLKNIEFSEMDDPTSFAIYTSEDLSKKGFFGLDYLGCKDEIERNDYQKVKVSKLSKIILIVVIILVIILKLIGM